MFSNRMTISVLFSSVGIVYHLLLEKGIFSSVKQQTEVFRRLLRDVN